VEADLVAGSVAEARSRAPEFDFDLIRGDLPFRLQRRIGLVPKEGLGVARRAILLGLLTWLPIAVWALLEGRALPGQAGEPLMQHFGIHVRCLVAIPLFIIGEATSHAVVAQFLRRLLDGGFVTEGELPRLRKILAGAARLRDGWLPWFVVAGLVLGWAVAAPTVGGRHELIWASHEGPAGPILGFGGWWFLYVVRPIFIALLLGWAWRYMLWCIVLVRVLRLDLALVPTHPDQAMGLGFIERTPGAFMPLIFALSAVLAATWGHDVLYHDLDLRSLRAPMAVFAVVTIGIMLVPMLVCAVPLTRAKRQALADYGALVAEYSRRLRERWILGKQVSDVRLLDAPEIGPFADTVPLYQAVKNTRTIPITRKTLAMILVPLALPMIALSAAQVPIKQLLLTVLKTLA
jgi:hypothetical protein